MTFSFPSENILLKQPSKPPHSKLDFQMTVKGLQLYRFLIRLLSINKIRLVCATFPFKNELSAVNLPTVF
jgi:hypothetical protein